MTTVTWDDVASFQGAFNPTRMTVAKATQGTTFLDSQYGGNKARAAAKDLPFGAYHFLDPGNAVAQAKHAFAAIGKVPSMLDIEVYQNKWPSLTDVVTFIKEFRTLGGIMRVSYLPHWFWVEHWGSPNLKALGDLQMKNINSDYSSASDASAMAAFGGLPNLGRQFTSTPHDMNRANMTQAQLWMNWTGTAPPATAHPVGSRQLYLTSPQMNGADVKWVQQHIGAAHAGAADGNYGPNTVAGVQWWQKQHKIGVDGRVGPQTYKTMGVTMK